MSHTYNLLLVLVLLSISLAFSTAQLPLYSAVSSKIIQPYSSYNVSIFVEKSEEQAGAGEPIRFTATVNSRTENYTNDQEISVSPGSSGILSIPVESLNERSYNLSLKIKDGGGKEYENKSRIYPAKAEEIILIQTDKPIYKPGETVRFRVVLLDGDLKPLNGHGLKNVKISDAEGNVIKVWQDGRTSTGIFKAELELSSEPVLGGWSIQVEIEAEEKQRKLTVGASSGAQEKLQAPLSILPPPGPPDEEDEDDESPRETTQTKSLTFQVDKYVLPKFEVTIKPPAFLTFNDTKVPVQVKAKYTYGKGVTGSCTLRTKFPYYYHSDKNGLSTVLDIQEGSSIVEVDLKQLFGTREPYETDIEFEASVTENVTGIVRNGTASVRIHRYPYKIEPVEKDSNVKPGLPFKVTFKVTTQDDKPISDPSPNALKVSHGFSYWSSGGSFYTSIPADGIVNLTFDTPTNELIQVQRIELKYKELTRMYYVPQKFNSEVEAYMQLSASNEGDKILTGSDFSVIVNATKPIKALNYIISNGKQVLASDRVTYEKDPKMEVTLKLTCPLDAAPQATLLVYTFLADGNIVGDTMTLKVAKSNAGNFLNISSSQQTGEPGENVTLTLTTTKNSIVALRGVDQSVLLLSEDTDITQKRLDGEIREKNEESGSGHRVWGGSSSFQLFEDSGLTIVSNGKIGKPEESWNTRFYPESVAFSLASVDSARPMASPVRAKAPVALASSGGAGGQLEIRVRSNFPETWIWEELNLNGSATAEVAKTLPDTLTSWVITGFSLNSENGIGILQTPTKLTTVRPFFITLNLPYSVVKGEVLVLQILVHNYLDQEVSAEVSLENSEGHFQFAEKSMKDAKVGKKVISSKGNTVSSVEFPIVPQKFGSVMLNVKATTGMAGDALTQALRVKPPGQRVRRSEALLLTQSSANDAAPAELQATFPEKRVEGADQVRATIIADILGPTAANLDKLLHMPTGCGEQNMLNFVADIVVLDYLKSSNSLVDAVKSKAIRFLESGYQRELTYKHSDGSYSAFGTSDPRGSTWLTAFVVRSFIAAQPHIYIDENVISSALNFLAEQQMDNNGGFFESGKVLHSDIQGGSNTNGVALTAYSAIAFIEAAKNFKRTDADSSSSTKQDYSTHISKALDFIVNKTSDSTIDDPYALVITTYALHLANHSAKDEYFYKLEKAAKTEGGFMYWTVPEVNKTGLNDTELLRHLYNSDTKPVSVEMTGYALLTYLLRGQGAQAFPLVRWLLKQRNANGGFISTQDTVVGLTALAKYAQLTKSPETDLVVSIDDGKQRRSVSIKDADKEVLNEFVLAADTRRVMSSVQGKGNVLVSLDYEYYVEQPPAQPAFNLDLKATGESGQLKVRSCVNYLGEGSSNMAIVEVNLPSGYAVDRDSLDDLKEVADYKRYDLENGDSRVSVYFDSLSSAPTCFNVVGNRIFKIGNPAAAYVTVYDYYDTTRKATAYYEPAKVSICDICQENGDCDMNNCI